MIAFLFSFCFLYYTLTFPFFLVAITRLILFKAFLKLESASDLPNLSYLFIYDSLRRPLLLLTL